MSPVSVIRVEFVRYGHRDLKFLDNLGKWRQGKGSYVKSQIPILNREGFGEYKWSSSPSEDANEGQKKSVRFSHKTVFRRTEVSKNTHAIKFYIHFLLPVMQYFHVWSFFGKVGGAK